jgi:hypothetical protein
VRKPRYDLVAAQAANLQVSESCLRRANDALLFDRPQDARAFIRQLFGALQACDFVESVRLRRRSGPPAVADVYGKRWEELIWYVKFEFDGRTTTLLYSCHEAEHPLKLADGRELRSRGPR